MITKERIRFYYRFPPQGGELGCILGEKRGEDDILTDWAGKFSGALRPDQWKVGRNDDTKHIVLFGPEDDFAHPTANLDKAEFALNKAGFHHNTSGQAQRPTNISIP